MCWLARTHSDEAMRVLRSISRAPWAGSKSWRREREAELLWHVPSRSLREGQLRGCTLCPLPPTQRKTRPTPA